MTNRTLTIDEAVEALKSNGETTMTWVEDTPNVFRRPVAYNVVLESLTNVDRVRLNVEFKDTVNKMKASEAFFYKTTKLNSYEIMREVNKLMAGNLYGWNLHYKWWPSGTGIEFAPDEDAYTPYNDPVFAISAWYAFNCGRDTKPILIDHAADVFASYSGLGPVMRNMRFIVGLDEYMILSYVNNNNTKSVLLRASVADVDGSMDYWLYQPNSKGLELLNMVTDNPVFNGSSNANDYKFIMHKGTAAPNQAKDIFKWFGEAVNNDWSAGQVVSSVLK